MVTGANSIGLKLHIAAPLMAKVVLKKPACTATMVVILLNYKDLTVHCMCICD